MIVLLHDSADAEDRERVELELRARGLEFTRVAGGDRAAFAVARAVPGEVAEALRTLPGVERVVGNGEGQGLVCREYRAAGTTVRIGSGAARPVEFSPEHFVVVAGPCAVESREQLRGIADAVSVRGAAVLRGGAYKPRSSPYSFQGLGVAGLELLAEQRRRLGLPVVTEVVDPADIGRVAEHADMLQIGARNMQNFALLAEAGRCAVPVLLKRGLAATVAEWLCAAEYLLAGGNDQVVLCERGIRTYEPSTRFTLDLSAVPVAARATHLPVVVDPSHASGRRDLVAPLALAAAAVGAAGVLLDVHTDPAAALCDGDQALSPEGFAELVEDLDRLLPALGRSRLRTDPVTAGVL